MFGLFLFLGLTFSYGPSLIPWWLLVGATTWALGVLFDLLARPWTRRAWAFEGGLVERVRGHLSVHPWDTASVTDWHSPDTDDPEPHKWDLELRYGSTMRISRVQAELLLARVPALRHSPAD